MNQPIPLNPQGHQDSQLPERRDAAENRARILKAAEDLFAERGVSAVNMADVAQAAAVGKGTLYRNFSNKGDLCLTLLDTQLHDFQEQRLAAMRDQAQSGLPYLLQLARFLDALVTFSDKHMPLLCEVQQYSDALDGREARRPHFWQYMTVRGLLRSAVQAAELPHGFDTEFAAEALLAPLAPHTFRFQREVLGFELSRMSRGLRTMLDGLGTLA
jgi:AcrR family transcriptional regulator